MRGAFLLFLLAAIISGMSFPAAGSAAKDRDEAVRQSLAWLGDALNREEWLSSGNVKGNVAAKRRVVEATCAYLFLLYPELRGFERLRKRLDRIARTIANAGIPPIEYGHFANWVQGFSALYLLELAHRGGTDGLRLQALAAGMERRQNAEGGWGHGLSLGLDFYPSTLIAASYWALIALGGCRRLGVDVDDEVIEEAIDLLRGVQTESGGFPYGGPSYLKGVEAGRTSGVVFALAALDLREDALFENAARYVRRNLESIPYGHASPAMHILMGSMGARVIGEDAWKAYDEKVLARLWAAQTEDGSFQDIVEGSPDSLGIMADDLTNRAYITALYAAALAAPRSRLAALYSADIRDEEPADVSPLPISPSLAPLWIAKVRGEGPVALFQDRCAAYIEPGFIQWFSSRNGESLDRFAMPSNWPGGLHAGMAPCEDQLLLWNQEESNARLPQSIRDALTALRDQGESMLVCFDRGNSQHLWQQCFQGSIAALSRGGDGVYLLIRSGAIRVHELSKGELLRSYPRQKVKVNVAIAPLTEGALAVASEANLYTLDASGEILWKGRNRGRRGITPPAFAALAARDALLYTGASDGTVCCREIESGRLVWSVKLSSAVRSLVLTRGKNLALLTWDRQIHGIEEGRNSWVFDIGLGLESLERPELKYDGRFAWASDPATGRLVALDPESGKAQAILPVSAHAYWDAKDGRVVVSDKEEIAYFEIK